MSRGRLGGGEGGGAVHRVSCPRSELAEDRGRGHQRPSREISFARKRAAVCRARLARRKMAVRFDNQASEGVGVRMVEKVVS